MEQNREPRNEPTPTGFMTKEVSIYNGKKTLSLINGLGKLDSYMKNNKIGPLSHTIYKKILKWIKDLNVISETRGSALFDIGLSNIFFGFVFPRQGNQKQK